ncbi:hypothetical protein [Nocardia niigatensis]
MARLVVAAAQILDYVGGVLIVPQSVLVQQYWHEIRAGLQSAGIRLRHFVLHAGRAELTRRIASDPAMPNSPWRLEHLDDYEAARSRHRGEARIIDTTELRPGEVADTMLAEVEV